MHSGAGRTNSCPAMLTSREKVVESRVDVPFRDASRLLWQAVTHSIKVDLVTALGRRSRLSDRLFNLEILFFFYSAKFVPGLRALEQLNKSYLMNMAPIKRKGASAEEAVSARQPQKRVRVGAEERKDQKKQKTGASGDGKSKPDAGSGPNASELTVLRDDEPSFPRGGGSVLTPLERKQIQIQATKDVLFEQKTTKGSSKGDEHDEDAEMEDVDDTTATTTKKSRKRKTKGKKSADDAQDKQGVRIEGLNFKVSLPRILCTSFGEGC